MWKWNGGEIGETTDFLFCSTFFVLREPICVALYFWVLFFFLPFLVVVVLFQTVDA